jgi:hypothetical protein
VTGVVLRGPDDGVCDESIWDGQLHLWTVAGSWRRIARRGIVATILARYVGVEPRELQFGRDGSGKPELVPSGPGGSVPFSVSTTAGMLALAVGASAIGVDVESRTRKVSVEDMMDFICTERERAELGDLMTPSARAEAFIWCWTGKEACAKACGLGLAVPFTEIDAGVGPVGGMRTVPSSVGPPVGPWELHRVDAFAGYAVSVAVL